MSVAPRSVTHMDTAALVDPLTVMLDIESRHRRHTPAKEAEIRDRTGLGAVRYYQVLDRLLDTGRAVQRDPLLVARLRRSRVSGRGAASAG